MNNSGNANVPVKEKQVIVGAKLASVSRLFGWIGLGFGVATIPLIKIAARVEHGRLTKVFLLFLLGSLSLTIIFGLANIGCAWTARILALRARTKGQTAANSIPASGLLGWGCLAALVINICAIPFLFPPSSTSVKNACINNLRQLHGAKEQWAFENKKTATDTPTWNDLLGTDRHIKIRPECPLGGTYSIGNMQTKPTCNVEGHSL